jgi:site-specific DNA-adenine methylase
MFPYFGRKARLAKLYPEPIYPVVIEPFAGSLSYGLHYRSANLIGYEKDARVVDLWNRLLESTGDEIPPVVGEKTDDLLVKLCSYSEHALTSGTMTVTKRMIRDWKFIHQRAFDIAPWAKEHVKYIHGSYTDAPDIEATWFIDPPYQKANRRGYLFGGSTVDFNHLQEWCKSRKGQVIVCEQEGADWLPFTPFKEISSHRGSLSTEVVWFND